MATFLLNAVVSIPVILVSLLINRSALQFLGLQVQENYAEPWLDPRLWLQPGLRWILAMLWAGVVGLGLCRKLRSVDASNKKVFLAQSAA